MESLEKRIADRLARGKANAAEGAPINPETGEKRAPTKEEIEIATPKTTVAAPAATPKQAKEAAKEWKPNA
jgi:hypothetical protein